MRKGQRFTAKDKLNNQYDYKFIGEEKTLIGYDIHLYNETTKTDTFVENEWFNQRHITIK